MTLLAYFSLTPLYIIANAIVVMCALVLAGLEARRREGRAFALGLSLLVVIPSVAYWSAFALWTDFKREMTFNMTWSVAKASTSYPNADHILLRFESFPNHFIGIYSTDLRTYLETLPSNDIEVTFVVTTDFGRTRGYNPIRIGELTSWNASGGYGGTAGGNLPSPWP